MSKIKTLKKGLYQHYKGPMYRVIDIARHSETEESLVIYQALYGEKGIWARPFSMFTETVELDGKVVPRFAYCDAQTAVQEVVNLHVKNGQQAQFELNFKQAQKIFESIDGYMSHDLQQCIELENHYFLFVNWQTLESHTEGFQGSQAFNKFRELVLPFYESMPEMKHYKSINN